MNTYFGVLPCNTNVNMSNVPFYVGSDYYCVFGNTYSYRQHIWYTNDPLWNDKQRGEMEVTLL